MGLIRCENGHLFSEKKYGNVCPYCNTAVNKNSNKEEDPLGKYSDVVYLNDLEVLKPVTGGWYAWKGHPKEGTIGLLQKKILWDAPAIWKYGLLATRRSARGIMRL